MTTGRELEINLSTLLGLNNRRPDFRLRTKDGAFLRAASNALISDAGTAKRRPGYAPVLNGADCHSFWVDRASDIGFYVDGQTLYRVRSAGDGLSREALAGDLVSGRGLTYCRVGTDIVFSDGFTTRCVGAEGVRPFGVPELSVEPLVSAVSGGGLDAGVYQVCFAFANTQLEFSGTTPALQVDVSQGQALSISGLPATWPAGADILVIYASAPNGETMFAERRLTAPTASLTIPTLGSSGMQVTSYLKSALPAGHIVRHYGGRLYVAAGSVLWYSDIYSPTLCDRSRSFVQFSAPITVMEPCDDGFYLVSDATYWLAGDIEAATLKEVLPCTAVFGSAGHLSQEKKVFWMSSKGMAVGAAGGQVDLMHDENVVVSKAAAGASFVLETDGQRHAVSSLFGAERTAAAARSYMDAEVIRKGTTL